MKEISLKKYVKYLFGISMFVFILNKFYLRPWVLENEFPFGYQIIVLSIPNLLEAVMGTIILTGILIHLKRSFSKRLGAINDTGLYLLAVIIAAVYVLTQEFKLHNLGGKNVYDIYDVIASIIGLVLSYGLLRSFGILEDSEISRSDG